MIRYTYKAKQGVSKIVDGVIEADNVPIAVMKIKQLGLTPLDVTPLVEKKSLLKNKLPMRQFSFARKISPNDVVLFTRQMSDLVDASVPILRSLQITSNQISNPAFKAMLQKMYTYVKDGGSFSGALAQNPKVFSNLYINMVKTGEVSGQLEIVLARLAVHLENEQETIAKVRSSLAYPAVILGVGALTIFVLLTFVIPKLSEMFDDIDQALPLPTLILMKASAIFASYGWLMALLVIGAVIFFRKYLETVEGRKKWDQWLLKTPLIGEFLKVVEIGRVCRTLGTLVENGVPITMSLNSVTATVDNLAMREEVKRLAQEVSNGASLKGAMSRSSFFPEMVLNMVAVGEETGRLDKSLFKVADTYEKQADRVIKTIVSLLGPIVLVFIVSIVGFVVVAMMLPIFKMNLLIK